MKPESFPFNPIEASVQHSNALYLAGMEEGRRLAMGNAAPQEMAPIGEEAIAGSGNGKPANTESRSSELAVAAAHPFREFVVLVQDNASQILTIGNFGDELSRTERQRLARELYQRASALLKQMKEDK